MTGNVQTDQFLRLLEANIGIILKIAGAYSRSDQDKEDLINDIVLELWKSFESFRGDSKISTWIYRVALNTSMNFNRKKERDKLIFSGEMRKTDFPEWISIPDDKSDVDILYQCIDELNQLNKAIILLYLDGNSYEEISAITGISKTNVGTRIGRIKEQLKTLANLK